MLDKQILEEFKDEILDDGVRFHMNLEGHTVEEFALVLLALINVKSSRKELGVVAVRTFECSNIIEIDTKEKEATYQFIRQFPQNDSDITVFSTLKIVVMNQYGLMDVLGVPFDDEEALVEVQVFLE